MVGLRTWAAGRLPPIALIAGLAASGTPAQEWTRFRGPNGMGLSDAAGIPTSWTDADLNWKVELPGKGHSQPVVWGDRIFVTCATSGGRSRLVLAIRRGDGSVEWTHRLELEPLAKNPRNSDASGSPAVDEKRVYVAFGSPRSHGLFALEHSGSSVWSRDLGPYKAEHGSGNSPIVFENLVVLANEHDGESFVVAADRETGEIRWKTPRRSARAAYGTPHVYREADGRPALLLTSQAHGIYSLDARTGAPNWEAHVFDMRTVSSPVLGSGLAIGTCGSGGGGNHLAAVRIGGKGDVSSTHLAYRLNQSIPYVPTSIVKDGLLFLWAEKGFVTCAEVSTGRQIWRERVEGSFYGSPVCIGDRLYCMSEDGEAVVIAAAREFRVLARNKIGEGSRSTPAVAAGRVYLRTYTHLLSLGRGEGTGR